MNILFLFQKFSYDTSTIYLDLVRECVRQGHRVMVVAGTSQDENCDEIVKKEIEGYVIKTAYVKLPDQFSANKIKKGLVQLFIGRAFLGAIKRLLWQEDVDIIAYPTPPITLAGVVKKAKRHFKAKTYLMLKDIFPQNAVDLHMMKENSLIHKYFRRMEDNLYEESDFIGCMSPANVEYMKKVLPKDLQGKLELFPNTVEILPLEGADKDCKIDETAKQGASDKVRFVLGGNLGKPQAVDFLLVGIEVLKNFEGAEFLIIGDGTESKKVESFIQEKAPKNLIYKKSLPRREYEELIKNQDVGIISLSADFTIPNFPSRLLSYLQMGKPVLVVADSVTDIGRIVEEADCGYSTPAGDAIAFVNMIKKICEEKEGLVQKGKNGRELLIREYDVKTSVERLEAAMEK